MSDDKMIYFKVGKTDKAEDGHYHIYVVDENGVGTAFQGDSLRHAHECADGKAWGSRSSYCGHSHALLPSTSTFGTNKELL